MLHRSVLHRSQRTGSRSSSSSPRSFFFVTMPLVMMMAAVTSQATPSQWTSAAYPDIRGTSAADCMQHVPGDQLLYVCDPDRVLNNSQGLWLNAMLHELSMSTDCHCQRRSQCAAGADTDALHGFVVSIAIVQHLQMTMHSPSELQLTERAESFCRALEGKWALGDCGNSLIIFVWQHYKKMIIWPARLAERYVTSEERRTMLAKVNTLAQQDDWYNALSEVIIVKRLSAGDLSRELKGDPESRVDTGTLSLVISVGVALSLTLLITCCVCAFRCCGNLKNEEGRVIDRVDNLRASVGAFRLLSKRLLL